MYVILFTVFYAISIKNKRGKTHKEEMKCHNPKKKEYFAILFSFFSLFFFSTILHYSFSHPNVLNSHQHLVSYTHKKISTHYTLSK